LDGDGASIVQHIAGGGRTKEQVLRTIKAYDLADMLCSKITSADIIALPKL
jgi:hypothetical protein